MRRLLYGVSAIAIVSVCAVAIKAGVEPPQEKAGVGHMLAFFFAVAMAMGIGALVFEVGKVFAGESKS